MAIATTKRPYEFLVRWRGGTISGAHVGFELTTIEDGKELATVPLPVMEVNIGQGRGFPLDDILKQLHIDAIAQMEAANAERDTAIAERDAALAVKDAALSSKAAAIADATDQIAELEAALAKAQPEE